MKRSELVYSALSEHALSGRKEHLTQLGLSQRLNLSLSVINKAIAPLREIGAVQVKQRSLQVQDSKKLLLFWASARRLGKEIIYQTRVDAPASQIEKQMPSGVLFTAYSGYKFLFSEVPADYSEIYAYSDEEGLQEIKKRFPKKEGPANLFVLKAETAEFSFSQNSLAPLPQIYVDLWNLPQWHAKEFLNALEKRFGW